MAVLYALMGNDPPQFSGTWYRCVCTFSDSPGDVATVVDYYGCMCMVVLGLAVCFHCMSGGRYSDSTPGSTCVPLCVHGYRAFSYGARNTPESNRCCIGSQ